MENIKFKAEQREKTGGLSSKQSIYNDRKIPGIIYGGKDEPLPILINENDLIRVTSNAGLFNSLVEVEVGDKKEMVVFKEVQKHPSKNVFTHEEKDLLVQRYIKTPLLLEDKKFDLRLYVLVKGFDPMEAYLADEGLARLCTEPYRQPNAANMKNMFMHLTNFSLNKNSENYKAPDENFLANNDTSKRLLTQLYQTLEEQGHDVAKIKESISDTVKKCVVAMEPYLQHAYHTRVSQNHANTKAFQILGMDILLDKKMNAWLMEVNANPSLNMFLEKDMPPDSGFEPEKILSELDKYVKTKVVTEAVRLVTGQGSTEYEGSFEQLLPSNDEDYERYYIWNRALQLYELMIKTGKVSEAVTLFQFSKLARVTEFSRAN